MTSELNVYLDGVLVGRLRQTSGGSISFTYEDAYRGSPDATPLSLSMPLVRSTHKDKPVRAFLQGLLPDSEGRLRQLANEFQVSSANPFALLAHVGRDAAGAVQILPPDVQSADAASRQGDVTEMSESRFADVIADLIANRDTWGRRDPHVHWSLPGAQPKIALFRTGDGAWATPNDATPTTHIIKPAVPPYSDHHINEFMTMAAARHLGLDVAEDFLVSTSLGDAAFVSVRYDRAHRDGRWMRLHQEDLAQALAYPPSKKYQSDNGPGVGRIAELFRGLPDRADRDHNSKNFYDALVFNLAAQGTDAHAKNYSLLLEGDHATLAPLYDLGSHAPYPTRGGAPLKLAMSIDGEYRMDAVGIDALTRAGVRLGIPAEVARERAIEITSTIAEAFDEAAGRARVVLGDQPFINELVDGIASYATARGWR